MTASTLLGLNSQIKQYKELFDSMQSLTGISIPSADTKKRSNFFDKAEENFNDNIVLEKEQHQLQKINDRANNEITRSKKDDFLEKAEHIMKVD